MYFLFVCLGEEYSWNWSSRRSFWH